MLMLLQSMCLSYWELIILGLFFPLVGQGGTVLMTQWQFHIYKHVHICLVQLATLARQQFISYTLATLPNSIVTCY